MGVFIAEKSLDKYIEMHGGEVYGASMPLRELLPYEIRNGVSWLGQGFTAAVKEKIPDSIVSLASHPTTAILLGMSVGAAVVYAIHKKQKQKRKRNKQKCLMKKSRR